MNIDAVKKYAGAIRKERAAMELIITEGRSAMGAVTRTRDPRELKCTRLTHMIKHERDSVKKQKLIKKRKRLMSCIVSNIVRAETNAVLNSVRPTHSEC